MSGWDTVEKICGWRPRKNPKRTMTYGDLSLMTGRSPQELMALSKAELRKLIISAIQAQHLFNTEVNRGKS